MRLYYTKNEFLCPTCGSLVNIYQKLSEFCSGDMKKEPTWVRKFRKGRELYENNSGQMRLRSRCAQESVSHVGGKVMNIRRITVREYKKVQCISVSCAWSAHSQQNCNQTSSDAYPGSEDAHFKIYLFKFNQDVAMNNAFITTLKFYAKKG